MILAPCKDCESRAVGCRSACKAWKAFTKDKEEEAKERAAMRKQTSTIYEYINHRTERRIKRYGK